MKHDEEDIRIVVLDAVSNRTFRSVLTDLYIHAFTKGAYAQQISPAAAAETLDTIVTHGTGCVALYGDRPVGFVAFFPLDRDADFPAEKCADVPVDESAYIAEVLVHADFRGKGIAGRLIEWCLQRMTDHYRCAVIRVWRENLPALQLYRKMGFTPVAEISQQKRDAYGVVFTMHKVYMLKWLHPDDASGDENH